MFFLIGHRGVGKSSLVSKIPGGVDLDQRISEKHDINSFFENGNEQGFRDLEKSTLKSILNKKKTQVVALGAGFELDKFNFPEDSVFIWIQRRSDLNGRVFFDRPKVNKNLSPLDDYFDRFETRQKIYSKHAGLNLELLEGAENDSALKLLEKWFIGETCFSAKAYYTIKSIEDLKFYSGNIELRTDFLTEVDVLSVLNKSDKNNYILAVRTKVSKDFFEKVAKCKNLKIDCPIDNKKLLEELIEKTEFKNKVLLSSHEKISLSDLEFAASKNLHLKWAPQILSLKELRESYNLCADRDFSFLPRSEEPDGRWKWMRESLFYKNKINFYRTGLTEYMDQISVHDLDVIKDRPQNHKGAVLGEDIFLSRSPGFHRSFFKERFSSFYSGIPLKRNEFNNENFDFIRSFGYSFFSVTAPFKDQLAFLGCEKSLNTISTGIDGLYKFTDTDRLALEFLTEQILKYKKPLIWGSGSMGKALKELIGDKAKLISARQYESSVLEGFDALVWCAGPNAFTPKLAKAPYCIFDLEYKEQSRAKQVAIEWGTSYISGEDFFVSQAKAQQSFWLETGEEK